MSEIRRLSMEELDTFMTIAANAYPRLGWDTPERWEQGRQRLQRLQEEDPTIAFYGLFRQGKLLGGMRMHDFVMNLFGELTPVGGVGMVAVDLLHKKRHVAKELIEFFLYHYREREAPLALLYPFRPDFYRKMGFGYGTKKSRYCLLPQAFPRGGGHTQLRFLDKASIPALLDCYMRYTRRTHGMITRTEKNFRRLLDSSGLRVVGYVVDEKIQGYLAFTFKAASEDNFIHNNLHVVELVYEEREVLAELLAFLATQLDQVNRVVIDTFDHAFHHLFWDPRDGNPALIPSVYHETNVQGVGLMYRVLDLQRLFESLSHRNFGGQTLRLQINLRDTFLPENAGSLGVHFIQGKGGVVEGGDHDVAISLDVASLSSLMVGAARFRQLYTYGLIDLSDPSYLGRLDRLFAVSENPVCMTSF